MGVVSAMYGQLDISTKQKLFEYDKDLIKQLELEYPVKDLTG